MKRRSESVDDGNAKSKRQKVRKTQKAEALYFAKVGNAKRKMLRKPNSLWQFGCSFTRRKVWSKRESVDDENAKSKRQKVRETQKTKVLHFAKVGNAKGKVVGKPNSLWQFGSSFTRRKERQQKCRWRNRQKQTTEALEERELAICRGNRRKEAKERNLCQRDGKVKFLSDWLHFCALRL
jgi:hypothetical protein